MIGANLYILSLACYFMGLLLVLLSNRRAITTTLMTMGMVFNCAVLVLRYWHSFPMMPMYFGLPALPFALSTIWLFTNTPRQAEENKTEGLLIQSLILFLGITALIFPKDFYIPFRRSATLWAHLFLMTGIIAKSCLVIAAVKSQVFLLGRRNATRTSGHHHSSTTLSWALWGFVWLTISMFSGEVWSYLGWGTPVIWHDPAITTIMGIWFYCIGFLHLHHTGSWGATGRAGYMVIGGILVLIFTCKPDMGPFRLPF